MGIESLALRRQLHAAAGAQEQAAAELRLEIVHGARQVRLAVLDQRLRRAGKAAVPRYGFKDAVIIQRNVHVFLLYRIEIETISTIDYPYKNRAIIIHPWNGIKEESIVNEDLTSREPSRVLWKFCLPLFGSIIFQQLYNIADSFVAGKFIGENALAAVGNSL